MVRDIRSLESPQAVRSARGWAYPLVKRTMDVALCMMIMPLALIMIMAIAVAIRLDSGGPVLFRQERIGRSGRPFRLYKFRTLRRDYDDQSGREYMRAYVRGEIDRDASTSDRRINKPIDRAQITRVGGILRKTSLDELPQIFNVLRGEMSLVGPRPNVPWEVMAYYDWHKERLNALPGITGLAQVRGRSYIAFDDIVRSDIEYIQHQSLKLDLKILWWTLASVLGGRGAG